VDACRSRGLKVGLYYCFPGDYSDAAHKNASPPGKPNLHGLPPEAAGDFTGFMKKQLAELLTNYGPIDLLWIDQYANYLLNVPPDRDGLISGPHLQRLREIGALLRR
jgi:alpha-L-fucosidase